MSRLQVFRLIASSALLIASVTAPLSVAAAPKESCFNLFRALDLKPQELAAAPNSQVRNEQAAREPLPPDRDPLFDKAHATEISKQTDKLGDYSLVTLNLPKNRSLKIVVDAKADWLVNALESFAKKPANEITDQKTIKAFVEHLSQLNLKSILGPKLRQYRGVVRDVKKDGDAYYLEELISSGRYDDLAITLIGQSMLETFAKKDARIVHVNLENEKRSRFGVMILNGNPDVFVPGKCSNKACGEKTIVTGAPLKTKIAPSFANVKEKKQFTVIDSRGREQLIQVQTRSAIERMVKAEREQIETASGDELVPVEIFEMLGYLHGGHTEFRIGDEMYNFGFDGWTIETGTEAVKGALLSNPYLRWSLRSARGMGIPPFNAGVKLMIPKSKVEKVREIVRAQMNAPDGQKIKFDILKSNCAQMVLRAFKEAGVEIARPEGFVGFSSSLSFREIILNPKVQVASVSVYPMPGSDLTEAQYRNEYPHFLYRAYSVKEDLRLIYGPRTGKDRYHETVLLEVVSRGGGAVDREGLAKTMLDAGALDEASDLEAKLSEAASKNLITLMPLMLTSKGFETLDERANDYDLSVVLARVY